MYFITKPTLIKLNLGFSKHNNKKKFHPLHLYQKFSKLPQWLASDFGNNRNAPFYPVKIYLIWDRKPQINNHILYTLQETQYSLLWWCRTRFQHLDEQTSSWHLSWLNFQHCRLMKMNIYQNGSYQKRFTQDWMNRKEK